MALQDARQDTMIPQTPRLKEQTVLEEGHMAGISLSLSPQQRQPQNNSRGSRGSGSCQVTVLSPVGGWVTLEIGGQGKSWLRDLAVVP
jgi:hypothetical protein